MIKSKRDARQFIRDFVLYAEWDGTKHYFPFYNGEEWAVTLMKYTDGSFTLYKRAKTFWNLKEHHVKNEVLVQFIWEHRKFINRAIKNQLLIRSR